MSQKQACKEKAGHSERRLDSIEFDLENIRAADSRVADHAEKLHATIAGLAAAPSI
jgi:hypothetical protein